MEKHHVKGLNLPFVLLICLAVNFHANAQKISYDYDFAGNRISRKVINLPPPQSVKQHQSDSIAVGDMLAEKTIHVYPNPTKGALGVEITGGEWDENIDLILFSGQGVQLYHAKAQQGINPIDMTVHPEGWYILRVQAGEQSKEFKVVKN